MSDNKKAMNEMKNKDLNDLLDNALEDFDKLIEPSSKSNSTTTTSSSPKQSDKESIEPAEAEWTEEFIKQTLNQMDKNLQNAFQNGGGELNDLLQKLEQASVGNAASGEDNINTEFETVISHALKALSVPSENFENEADYLAAMLEQPSSDGDIGMFSFVQGMMQQLLSKEMLYPSLKELSDEYPAWLEEHEATLSPVDLQRYTKQLELMQKVCAELEKEKEDDTKDVKERRLKSVMSLIQEMEKFGNLPNELASSHLSHDLINKGILDEINSVFCGNE